MALTNSKAKSSSKKHTAKPVEAESSSSSNMQNAGVVCERWHRPHWQVELLQQQGKLQVDVESMQLYRNTDGFYRQSKHLQDGFIAQLNATRNLLDVVNERISYFA